MMTDTPFCQDTLGVPVVEKNNCGIHLNENKNGWNHKVLTYSIGIEVGW